MENAGNSYVGMLSQDGQWRWDGQQWLSANAGGHPGQALTYSPDGRHVWTAAGWRPVRPSTWTARKIIGYLVIVAVLIGGAFLVIDEWQRQSQDKRDFDNRICQEYPDLADCP